MPTLVSKFGGSSTANADCFRRVFEIVRASPARRCIVLSAPGTDGSHSQKVTAMLAECWRKQTCEAVGRVARRYGEIAEGLGVSGFNEIARNEIEAALDVSEAHVLSRGEYLCALLFSRFSGIPMVDSRELVRFDESGELNVEETLRRFESLSAEYARAIVPGFYGADDSGKTHLFPRNGSDITGALAAAGMGAGLYENWTDVPGLMSADPAIVPQAQLIPQVGYRQMRALSRAGARVLHPACLDPVTMAGIPTRLRNTMNPASFGTLIDERVPETVPCIAGKCGGDMAQISVFGIKAERVLAAARNYRILSANGDSVVVHVEDEMFEQAIRHLHRMLIG